MGLEEDIINNAAAGDYNLEPTDSERVPRPKIAPTGHVPNIQPNAVSDVELESQTRELLKAAGVDNMDDALANVGIEDRQKMVSQIYADAEKNAPLLEKIAKGIDRMDNNTVTRVAKDTVGQTANVAAGITLGISKAFYSGVNAFKEGYNYLGQLAEQHKIIEKFDPAQPISIDGFIDKNYPATTKVVADLTQAITPGVASAFVPGGPVAKTVGAAVSTYMLMDPKQKGLAELFKDTAVEKVFLLDEAFKYSEKKPNDTEMQGRLKNVLDYTFGEALIGAAVKGIYAMYNGAKQVKNVYYAKGSIEDAERVAANLDRPPATPPSPGVEPRPVVEQVPTKEAQAATKVRQEADQLDFESWVKALDPHDPEAYSPLKDSDPLAQVEITTPTPLNRQKALEGPTNINPNLVNVGDLNMPKTYLPKDESGGQYFIESGVTNSINLDFRGRKQLMNPVVKAYYITPEGKTILVGRIKIQGEPQKGKLVYSSGMTYVRPEHRGKGVATAMYDYADKYMAQIQPSRVQSYYGKQFWLDRAKYLAEREAKQNPEAFSKRGSQTTPEMLARAQERRKDPMYISNLIRQRAADPTSVFSAEDYLAIELEASDAAIRANTASQKALTTGSELDLLAANEALEHTLKLESMAVADSSEAGRRLGITDALVQAIDKGPKESVEQAMTILGAKGRTRLLRDYIESYGGQRPLEERLRIMDMINQMDDSQFVAEARKSVGAYQKIAKQTSTGRKIVDALYHVYTSSLMSVFKTPIVVGAINTSVGAVESMNKYLATSIGKVLGTEGASIGAANAYTYGWLSSHWGALKAGWQSFKAGKGPSGSVVYGPLEKLARTPEAAATNSFFGKLFEAGMATSTITGRVVMSADTIGRYTHEMAYIREQAYIEAEKMFNKLGKPLSEKAQYMDNFISDYMKAPPVNVQRDAITRAENLVMNGDISQVPIIGPISDAINSQLWGVGRFFFPFMNVGVSSVKYGMEYVPGLNFALKDVRTAFAQGGKVRDEAISKMMIGSVAAAGIYNLTSEKILTGEMPNSYKQQQALADGGRGITPYTLDLTQFGLGAYYMRPFDPVTRIMRLTGLFNQAYQSAQDPDAMSQMAFAFSAAMSQLTPEQFEGYHNFTDALVDATKGDTKAMSKFVANLGANLVPLAMSRKQALQAYEGYMAEDGKYVKQDESYREFTEYFLGKLSQGVGYGLPEKLDIFGEPIKEHWLASVTPFHSVDTENSALGKYLRMLTDFDGDLRAKGFDPKFKIEMPSDIISTKSSLVMADGLAQQVESSRTKMTSEEYHDFIKLMNKPGIIPGRKSLRADVEEYARVNMKVMADAMGGMRASYLTASQQEAAEIEYKKAMLGLNQIFRSYDSAARNLFAKNNPIIQKRLQQDRDKSRLAMPGFVTPFSPRGQ